MLQTGGLRKGWRSTLRTHLIVHPREKKTDEEEEEEGEAEGT